METLLQILYLKISQVSHRQYLVHGKGEISKIRKSIHTHTNFLCEISKEMKLRAPLLLAILGSIGCLKKMILRVSGKMSIPKVPK